MTDNNRHFPLECIFTHCGNTAVKLLFDKCFSNMTTNLVHPMVPLFLHIQVDHANICIHEKNIQNHTQGYKLEYNMDCN